MLPFRSVNKRGTKSHDPTVQRHHILPRQLLGFASFEAMLGTLGPDRIGFEDFRRNGLLLPSEDAAAVRMGLPLHRGPHRDYNEMVIERVSEIEGDWQESRRADQDRAGFEALRQLAQLQDSLRENLLMPGRSNLTLHSNDPIGKGLDYQELDDVAEKLWASS